MIQQLPSRKFTLLREQARTTLRQAGFAHALYFEMIDEGGRVLIHKQMLDLVLESDTAPLRRILRERIADALDGRTILELKRYALLEAVHRPSQVIDAVRQLRDAAAVTTEPHPINNQTRVRLATTPSTSDAPAEQTILW